MLTNSEVIGRFMATKHARLLNRWLIVGIEDILAIARVNGSHEHLKKNGNG